VESQNHPVLPSLWRRGHPPHGPGIRVAQSLGLEDGPGLDKGCSLLLELGLRPLASDLFLPEPLLRRGKGGGLVSQDGP
jgi:hypothetical protein